MTEYNSTYALIMPKVKLTPIKQKTKQEEVKEIIQNPNDPLAKYPLRAFGYSNEVGAAVSAMPGWGKAAELGLWVPALMYLGADIYDKYKRGKEGDYTKASASAAVEQAIFQALASVILPTTAVKIGQSIAGQFTKLDNSGLSATVKEELFEKLQDDFAKAKFAKGDRIENGVLKTARDAVWDRIYDHSFLHELDSTKEKIKKESIPKKILKFFGHPAGFNAACKTDRTKIEAYLQRKVYDIFDLQTILETKSPEQVEDYLKNKKFSKNLLKIYDKALQKAEKSSQILIKERPNFVIEKILSSGEERYKDLIKIIKHEFPNISDRKVLVSATDNGKQISSSLLKRLMKDGNNKELIENISQKATISNAVINKFIQNKKLQMGLLKTIGGFISLALLAIPIDNFVHKYIIQKFVEPGLRNVSDKLSFKSKQNS